MMTENKQKSPLIPVYLMVGEDSLKRASLMKRLRARVEEYGDLAFNCDEFRGENAVGTDIVAACNTLPFASDKRLVVVWDVDKLKKADSEPLVEYLKAPNDSTVLALDATALAKNTRLYKAIAAVGKGAIVMCGAKKPKEMPAYVRELAVKHGVTFSPRAAQVLVDLVGVDTVHLDGEVEKIALAHTGNAAVTDEEVTDLVVRVTEPKTWELVEAFSSRDISNTLGMLAMMKSASPHGMLPACVSRIRQLICVKSLTARGQAGSLAKELGMPDWKAKIVVSSARLWSERELRSALVSARDAERSFNDGHDSREAFMMWLVSTMSRS